MSNLKWLFLPGSLSLFVLLSFLQETYGSSDGLKMSNLRFAFLADVSGPLAYAQADVRQQFWLLLIVTLVFLMPPVIWVIFEAIKGAKQNGKSAPEMADRGAE